MDKRTMPPSSENRRVKSDDEELVSDFYSQCVCALTVCDQN